MIRKAEIDDIEQIAEVHVASWKSTYKGIVSDRYLESLSAEAKLRQWKRNLEQSDPILMVAIEDERVVGFVSAGKSRNEDLPFEAEIYAIYILEEYQRKGIGKALFDSASREFKKRGWDSMLIWVLAENSSKLFYEKMGGLEVARDHFDIEEEKLEEIGYGWDSLSFI